MRGTILVGLALLAVVIAIICSLIRGRRKGGSCASCGCGCSSCGAACSHRGAKTDYRDFY